MRGCHLAPISRRLLQVFAAVFALVVAILLWWIAFNVIAARQQRDEALARCQEQRELAAEMVALAAAAPAAAAGPPQAVLARSFPQLTWQGAAAGAADVAAARGRIGVRAVVSEQIDARYRGRVRMFLSEGAFFLAMVMLGGMLIVRAMRHEVSMTRSQANFVSAVTHELKSPLASIRLYVETMQMRDAAPPDRARYLGIIREDVDRLETLVGNLLAVARLDGAPAAARPEVVDLAAEVRRIAEPLAADFAARGAPLHIVAAAASLPVRVDVMALQTALRNLLDNAAKYGRSPRAIEVRVAREEAAALCEVQDFGIGIAAAELDKIFGKFYRVGDELVRQSEGSGLGLYLARALLEQSGGRLTAASQGAGTGATFRIRLPLAAAAPPVAA